jgi:hypothetical protein
MAYKQKGSPFQRNFKIGSPAKQMLKPRVAPTAAPMGAPAAPPPPPVDPAMVAQAAEAVKGAMAPPPADPGAMAPPPMDPGAEMPPPTQRNLRMEAASPMKFGLTGLTGRMPKPVNKPKPTTGGPQKGIVSTTPLPGGANPRKATGGRKRGLLGSLARGAKSIGKAVKGVREKVGGLAKGAIKNNLGLAKGVVKNVGGLAKGVAKAGLGGAVKLGGAVNAVKPKVIKK